jgi:hypothetical protein
MLLQLRAVLFQFLLLLLIMMLGTQGIQLSFRQLFLIISKISLEYLHLPESCLVNFFEIKNNTFFLKKEWRK